MSGNYPAGVHENTRGAPWNEHETVVCRGCRRLYYPDTQPAGIPRDDETKPPVSEFGIEFEFCETCECETIQCAECGETRTTRDNEQPGTVDGCESCFVDTAHASHCPACGGRVFQILGTLANRVHYRCRNCGADSSSVRTVDATRDAVRRAASISEQIDKGNK